MCIIWSFSLTLLPTFHIQLNIACILRTIQLDNFFKEVIYFALLIMFYYTDSTLFIVSFGIYCRTVSYKQVQLPLQQRNVHVFGKL